MTDDRRDREQYRQYPNTILEFDTPDALRIDLRRPLSDDDRRALDALGLREFGVFTAENPAGEHAEDEGDEAAERARERANRRRTRSLVERLKAEGTRFVRVDGVAPQGDHRERCVALAVARDGAVEMAERYEQLALFWYDGSDFWLLPAEADEPPTRLPALSRR